eukprot:CAMPEP_0176124252 /NCGR_PEP_ID=MMETSP0120_2-20121206/62642_1 /TAXON_ID=160619 /ORGANISM="Kryptoperidinium foliaceum, Strain CCMP 1326" /LENGTH=58 /DNA_ID=CAMNT_0017459017 /DNA_START=85 /DNA_END=261 /DNA_ORIENTATION=-
MAIHERASVSAHVHLERALRSPVEMRSTANTPSQGPRRRITSKRASATGHHPIVPHDP